MPRVIPLGTWRSVDPIRVGETTICVYQNDAGADWYLTVAWPHDRPKGTAVIIDEAGVIFAAGRDVNELHPVGGRVFVIDGHVAPGLSALMGKTLNTATGEIE